MKVTVSGHAVDRYIERVKPALSRWKAKNELEVFLERGVVLPAAPPWHLKSVPRGEYIEIADGIAVIVKDGIATTVIVRGGQDEEHREARRQAKREHRRRKRFAGARGRSPGDGRPRIESEAWPT